MELVLQKPRWASKRPPATDLPERLPIQVLARQNVASVPWIERRGERDRESDLSGSVLISAVTGRKKSVKSQVT